MRDELRDEFFIVLFRILFIEDAVFTVPHAGTAEEIFTVVALHGVVRVIAVVREEREEHPLATK